jgi:hypothetical protein
VNKGKKQKLAVYLFETNDPLGRQIRLTEDCYEFHILVEHPDMADVDEIARAVRTPDYITQDAIDFTRLVYYRTYRRQPQRWMIKVVVEHNEVVTAYRVQRLKRGEPILWRR